MPKKTTDKLPPFRANAEKLMEELRALGGNMVIEHDDFTADTRAIAVINVKEQFHVEGRPDISPVDVNCDFVFYGRTADVRKTYWSVGYKLHIDPYLKIVPPQLGFANVWAENDHDENDATNCVNIQLSSGNPGRKRLLKIKDAAGYAELRKLVIEMCRNLSTPK